MSDEHNQWSEICKGEFRKLHDALARVDTAIRGNGKPGLTLRIERLEAAAKARSRLLWLILGATIPLAIANAKSLLELLCR